MSYYMCECICKLNVCVAGINLILTAFYDRFYDLESGYAPCDDRPDRCLAPDGWFPEYSNYLGPPKGPAVQDGTVWTREFDGASVYVDLSNRSLSKITWKPKKEVKDFPEKRITCGGNYGFFDEQPWEGTPCPPPTWEPAWELNLSTTPNTPWGPEIAIGQKQGFADPVNASQWGWINFDWSDGGDLWQNSHPHDNEAVLVKQCQMVKALGTGTRCMVYRNTELALQWQETSRAAMTAENTEKGWFLKFKTQELCDAAPPCNIAAFHNIINQSAPLTPCNKDAPLTDPNCPSCCNFTGAYNEPIGGAMSPPSFKPRIGDNALNDGQFFWDFRNEDAQNYFAEKVCLEGAMAEGVDGMFTDDPGGYVALIMHYTCICSHLTCTTHVYAHTYHAQHMYILTLIMHNTCICSHLSCTTHVYTHTYHAQYMYILTFIMHNTCIYSHLS
jgi:hypothetical protein